MHIEKFPLTPFQQNTRVVVCQKTKKAICIDVGEKSDAIVNYLHNNNLELQAITLTHGHLESRRRNFRFIRKFSERRNFTSQRRRRFVLRLPKQPLLMGIPSHQLKAIGFAYENPPKLTRNWQHGEIYNVGELKFKVLHCPGHTRGHVVLFEETHRKVFVGDCLFAGSIGRTDLPGGSYEQLIDSITRNILTLGDDVVVYSGHGEETTIGREKTTNPFLTGVYEVGSRKVFVSLKVKTGKGEKVLFLTFASK